MSYQNGWKKKLIDIRIDMSNVKVGYGDKKVFNDLNRLITDISNNKVKKENTIERFLKSISDLNQLKQKKVVFQNMMIHVVYQLFHSFGLNTRLLPLFSEKEADQLRLPEYVKVSYDRFYKIKNNIDNNKDLTTRIKDGSGKTIIIDTKYAADLMDRVSKSGITYDKVKTIFNNEIVKSANIIASEKPSNNRICYEKYFSIWEKFLLESFTALKFLMINMRSWNVELKNKADDKQSKLETQNEPLSLTKKKNQNLKTVSLKEQN